MGITTSDHSENADRFRPDLSADYDAEEAERDGGGIVALGTVAEPYFSTRACEIDLNNSGIGLVFELSGILDIDSAPTLQLLFGRATTSRPPFSLLVIDLSQVEFIDSAGLVLLISLRQETGDNGCRLAVAIGNPPKPQVDRLWQISRFYSLFTTRGHIEEAVAAALSSPEDTSSG